MDAPLAKTRKSRKEERDGFYWIGQINKASAVINVDEGLLDAKVGARIATGLRAVLDAGNQRRGPRPATVITFEPLLIDAAGVEASLIHAGRSSQDMLTTVSTARIREHTLLLAHQLVQTTSSMVALAEVHADTLVPSYTNGVAAQPNAWGHYLLGHTAGLLRDAQRLEQFMDRLLERCPMGSAVLNGTSWPLNRERMAAYLGFPAAVDNAYDAVQIVAAEIPVELGALCTGLALHVGSFIQDIMVQYSQPQPWILLKEGGDNTYVSSAMPQKRNPGLLNRTRASASRLVAAGFSGAIVVHNLPTGMPDGKHASENIDLLKDVTAVLKNLDRILDALEINAERALHELNSDWTASQELADVLMRLHGIPFRVGHHFASDMVTFARAHHFQPSDFPYAEAQRIYTHVRDSLKATTIAGSFPLTEPAFRDALDPAAIVRNRKTSGGPQPAEMERMLADAKAALSRLAVRLDARQRRVHDALCRLDDDFATLLLDDGDGLLRTR